MYDKKYKPTELWTEHKDTTRKRQQKNSFESIICNKIESLNAGFKKLIYFRFNA